MKALKIIFGLVLATICIYSYAHGHMTGINTAVILFVANSGAAAVTNNSPTFTPNFIYFVAATPITSLRITPQGDSLTVDLDTAGLTAFQNLRLMGGIVTNSYMIPIADGKMPAQGIDIVFTNSAAQTPSVYGISMGKGANHWMSIRQTILPNSGTTLDRFGFLSLPSLAATDYANVIWKDGLQETFNRDEFAAMLPMTQGIAANYGIDNMAQQLQNITVYCGSQQIGYMLRLRPSIKPAI